MERGADSKLQYCEVCNLHTRTDIGHHLGAGHVVKAYLQEMEAKGWKPANGHHEIIGSISQKLLVRGPRATTSSLERLQPGGRAVREGFFAPAWAVAVAARVGIRISYRRQWLRQLFESEDLRECLRVHLALGGNVLAFFDLTTPDDPRRIGSDS